MAKGNAEVGVSTQLGCFTPLHGCTELNDAEKQLIVEARLAGVGVWLEELAFGAGGAWYVVAESAQQKSAGGMICATVEDARITVHGGPDAWLSSGAQRRAVARVAQVRPATP